MEYYFNLFHCKFLQINEARKMFYFISSCFDNETIGIILYALDESWELCEDAIHESEVLTNLLNDHQLCAMRSNTGMIV